MKLEKCEYCKETETTLRGQNMEPECIYCKKIRERAYDDYVDPLGFYRSKSIDNWD